MTPEVVPFPGIAVNQQVELELQAARPQRLLSRVEDCEGHQVMVAQPTLRNKPVRLAAGARVVLTWYTVDAVYKCEAAAAADDTHPVPVWRLEVPAKVIRLQRRGFVRIEIGLDVRYTILVRPVAEEGADPKAGADAGAPAGSPGPGDGLTVRAGRTRDLSAGGSQVVMDEALPPGTVLELTIDLAPGQRFSTIGEVVRSVTDPPTAGGRPGKTTVGVNFVGLDRRDQDFLVGYVFSRQREMRRKGLL